MKKKNIKVGEWVFDKKSNQLFELVDVYTTSNLKRFSKQNHVAHVKRRLDRFRRARISDLKPGDMFEHCGQRFVFRESLFKPDIEGDRQPFYNDTKVRIISLADKKSEIKPDTNTHVISETSGVADIVPSKADMVATGMLLDELHIDDFDRSNNLMIIAQALANARAGERERCNSRIHPYAQMLLTLAEAERSKATNKFPQPNYVLLKVAEEAGEVVKAAVHYIEGRETWENLETEVVQTIAMLLRLMIEGDQRNGLVPKGNLPPEQGNE